MCTCIGTSYSGLWRLIYGSRTLMWDLLTNCKHKFSIWCSFRACYVDLGCATKNRMTEPPVSYGNHHSSFIIPFARGCFSSFSNILNKRSESFAFLLQQIDFFCFMLFLVGYYSVWINYLLCVRTFPMSSGLASKSRLFRFWESQETEFCDKFATN